MTIIGYEGNIKTLQMSAHFPKDPEPFANECSLSLEDLEPFANECSLSLEDPEPFVKATYRKMDPFWLHVA